MVYYDRLLINDPMKTRFLIISVVLAVSGLTASAQQVREIFKFPANALSGQYPSGSGVVVGDQYFGVTAEGGNNGYGVLYRVSLTGAPNFTVLRHFTSAEGRPADRGSSSGGGLITDGTTVFGSLRDGGDQYAGSLFAFEASAPQASFRIIKENFGQRFNGYESWTHDGDGPSVVFVSGNFLYGTVSYGGRVPGTDSFAEGGVFRMGKDGSGYQLIHVFSGGSDGARPADIVDTGSGIIGATEGGGPANRGTLFRVDYDGGNYEQLKYFDSSLIRDGRFGGNLEFYGGSVYGVCGEGGVVSSAVPYPNGFLFSLSASGLSSASDFRILRSFGDTDNEPAGLVVGPQGVHGLFGQTFGSKYTGGIYQSDLQGKNFRILHRLLRTGSNYSSRPADIRFHGNSLVCVMADGGDGTGLIFTYTPGTTPTPQPPPEGEYSRVQIQGTITRAESADRMVRERLTNKSILRLALGYWQAEGYTLLCTPDLEFFAYRPGQPLREISEISLQPVSRVQAAKADSFGRLTGQAKLHLRGQFTGHEVSINLQATFDKARDAGEDAFPYPSVLKASFFGGDPQGEEFLEGTLLAPRPRRL